MPRAELSIRNPSGLHARPAATFVKAAAAYACDIRVTNLTREAGRTASAKSVLGVMGLGISRGHTIRLEAEGDDADAAIRELSVLVGAGLGESLDGPLDEAAPA